MLIQYKETLIIAYVIIAIIYQSITCVIRWKKMKKKLATDPKMAMMISVLKATPATGKMMKAIFSPFTIALIVILALCISPITFPVILIFDIVHLFIKKPKSETELIDAFDQAQNFSENFMQNEGRPLQDQEKVTFSPPGE